MLTYRQLEDAGEAYVRVVAEAEAVILDDMARRISKLDGITEATNWQAVRLQQAGAAYDTILKELSSQVDIGHLAGLFDEATTRTLGSDNKLAKLAGLNPIPLADNLYMQQIIRAGVNKTQGTLLNLTRTTAITATQQFVNALDLSHQLVVSGGFSYQQAIKQGLRTLSDKGLAAIMYPSGREDYLDVAFRRALLTGINQTAAEVQLENLSQLQADLVETTAHPGARPDHIGWQGHVFSLSGTHPKYPDFHRETEYGTAAGLCGVNCRHSFFPYFEGLSDPAYSADKLREYNDKTVMLDGKELSLYDATQRQREIERNIRKWKREADMLKAAGLDNSYARSKIAQWQAEQRSLIKQTGLSRDYFRERAGSQNWEKPKSLTPQGFSGIMSANWTGSLASEKSAEIMSKQKPMDRETVQRVKSNLLNKGVVIEQSAEWDANLIKRGREASTFSDGSMVMHTNVSASGFYEELIHYGQIKSGRAVEGDYHNELLMEIEAKERLIKHQKAYKITDYEIKVLNDVLDGYRAELKNMEKG